MIDTTLSTRTTSDSKTLSCQRLRNMESKNQESVATSNQSNIPMEAAVYTTTVGLRARHKKEASHKKRGNARQRTIENKGHTLKKSVALFSRNLDTSAGFWYRDPATSLYRGCTVLTEGFTLPKNFEAIVSGSMVWLHSEVNCFYS